MTGDLDDYLTELRVARRSTQTVRIRGIQLRVWHDWLTANDRNTSTATRTDAVRFLSRFTEPETAGAYRAAIRGYHDWLHDTGRRADDPTIKLPSIRRPEGDPHPVPDHVLIEVLAQATDRQKAMIVLGRFAGLRSAEIAAAHRTYLRGGLSGDVIRLQGKGGKWRELPAHPQVAEVLRSTGGWVFPRQRQPWEPVGAGRVSSVLSALLPDQWTAHSLRHAFATEAYARTLDLRLVQEWMGHASPRTTIRYVAVHHDHAAIEGMRLVA